MVEFSPATRETRVRFPAVAHSIVFSHVAVAAWRRAAVCAARICDLDARGARAVRCAPRRRGHAASARRQAASRCCATTKSLWWIGSCRFVYCCCGACCSTKSCCTRAQSAALPTDHRRIENRRRQLAGDRARRSLHRGRAAQKPLLKIRTTKQRAAGTHESDTRHRLTLHRRRAGHSHAGPDRIRHT